MSTVIKIEDVYYAYPRTKKWVLQNINLEIEEGDFIAVMGENGAGKTTLCQCLNGIIPHSTGGRLEGKMTLLGMDTKKASIAQLASNTGMVLEDPEAQLFTTVVRNEVAFGPENLQVDPEEIKRRVKWSLEVVGLSEYIDHQPTSLSGGQKQRLIIATALAMLPKVLILDEPTSQLDPVGTMEVFNVIRELKREHNITIVIATHKSEEIAEFADKVCVIKEGKIVALDKPSVIFSDGHLMQDNWIRIPQVSELANYLEDHCDPLANYPIVKEEAILEIEKWLCKRGTICQK